MDSAGADILDDGAIMGSDNHRCRQAVHLAENVHDLLRHVGIEIPRRLIGNEKRRPINERSRDGDALLLAARQHPGRQITFFRQPDKLEHSVDTPPRLTRGHPDGPLAKSNIIEHRPAWQQLEILKHDTDSSPETREFLAAKSRDISASDKHLPPVGNLRAIEEGEQRGFSRAARARDEYKLAPPHLEIDVLENIVPVIIALPDARNPDHVLLLIRRLGLLAVNDGNCSWW